MHTLDPLTVKLQIDQLFREFPEILEDEILLADSLEGQTDLHLFLSTVERSRQEAVALVKGTDLVLADLLQRKRRFERREEALRRLMFQMLQLARLRKLELPAATVSLRNGTPRVLITDESAIPDHLCRFKREPDKAAIKTAIQDGGYVAGATLSNSEETISIRTR